MGALTLFLTGAGSYVGRAAAESARRAGLGLVLHSRHGHGDAPAAPGVASVTGALDAPDLAERMQGCDAVIHVAGRMQGTEAQFQKDVVADSRAVMRAARAAGVAKVVLAGSVSVYGAGTPGATITEASPLEPRPDLRDAYTRAKLAQEAAMQDADGETALTILRLGAVWGAGRLWNAHIGMAKGPVLIRLGGEGQIPLCHVARAGEALVKAVGAAPGTFNILDDDLPDRVRYLTGLARSGWPRLVLPLPWRMLDLVARDGPTRLGLLRRPTLRARMMPMAWDGARGRAALGLAPQATFEALMAAALAEGGAP
ncbi:NAD-dependent epimerase/dehydratase family protein [Rhodobacteraceae bacterium W635]|uniref:NAD-dependent epimerase/dehydratase family protein n=1 Tax=Nioella halotolerans TaxID=2303578 RepID=UPI000E3CC7B5|nr:NAD-dependent epimerase/dehydratase family protein [Rhodobacteraceae bacterium W635]